MKKLHLLFIGMLSMATIHGQDISDAIRFSQDDIQGTARFRALSGAFGALGGDMSAISLNPAGGAVFSKSHASFTLSIKETDNNTQYFNTPTNSNDSNFNIDQGGGVFVFASNNNSPWRKFTIAIAYDKTSDHDTNWRASGLNTNDDGNFSNSIASYFYDFANDPGIPVRLGDISLLNGETKNQAYEDIGRSLGFTHQQAFLGFQSFILDADDENNNDNTSYSANVATGAFDHDYFYASTGYNGKVTFNMATQYEDNLYLGLNLNSHFIDYVRSTSLFERNSNGGLINEIDFRNTLTTTGNGFSFQLGGIMKLSPEFRIGITYDSPTWYTIEEEATQYLDTNELFDSNEDPIGSRTINIYPQYKLQTPSKITGSLAYVFGKQGLISFDYSRKDYSETKFKPEVDYTGLNTGINNILTDASTYRIGGEYKYEQISFRGGYRFEESPYVNGFTMGDLNGYSLGIGYNFGNTKLDVTYDQSKRSFETSLYNYGLTDVANTDQINSNITVSLSFNI